jgi:hypothetical protein
MMRKATHAASDRISEFSKKRHIGSLLVAPVTYIGLQDRANVARSLTA